MEDDVKTPPAAEYQVPEWSVTRGEYRAAMDAYTQEGIAIGYRRAITDLVTWMVCIYFVVMIGRAVDSLTKG